MAPSVPRAAASPWVWASWWEPTRRVSPMWQPLTAPSTWTTSQSRSTEGQGTLCPLPIYCNITTTASACYLLYKACFRFADWQSFFCHFLPSWLYNLFDGVIEDNIKKTLNDKMCGLASNAINNAANKALSSLPGMWLYLLVIAIAKQRTLPIQCMHSTQHTLNTAPTCTWTPGHLLDVYPPRTIPM